MSLKLKKKKYEGIVYIKPVVGTIRTNFAYIEIYDIGQNCDMNVIYDIATHEVTRVLFYRRNKKQNLDYLIQIASKSIRFFVRDWELPSKKTQQRVKKW